eukprot:jgi/Bigna1/88140/estExt_fgenesh1_pg.C_280156
MVSIGWRGRRQGGDGRYGNDVHNMWCEEHNASSGDEGGGQLALEHLCRFYNGAALQQILKCIHNAKSIHSEVWRKKTVKILQKRQVEKKLARKTQQFKESIREIARLNPDLRLTIHKALHDPQLIAQSEWREQVREALSTSNGNVPNNSSKKAANVSSPLSNSQHIASSSSSSSSTSSSSRKRNRPSHSAPSSSNPSSASRVGTSRRTSKAPPSRRRDDQKVQQGIPFSQIFPSLPHVRIPRSLRPSHFLVAGSRPPKLTPRKMITHAAEAMRPLQINERGDSSSTSAVASSLSGAASSTLENNAQDDCHSQSIEAADAINRRGDEIRVDDDNKNHHMEEDELMKNEDEKREEGGGKEVPQQKQRQGVEGGNTEGGWQGPTSLLDEQLQGATTTTTTTTTKTTAMKVQNETNSALQTANSALKTGNATLDPAATAAFPQNQPLSSFRRRSHYRVVNPTTQNQSHNLLRGDTVNNNIYNRNAEITPSQQLSNGDPFSTAAQKNSPANKLGTPSMMPSPSFYKNGEHRPPNSSGQGRSVVIRRWQLCRFYAQNRCIKGDQCPFMHPSDHKQEGETSHQSQPEIQQNNRRREDDGSKDSNPFGGSLF